MSDRLEFDRSHLTEKDKKSLKKKPSMSLGSNRKNLEHLTKQVNLEGVKKKLKDIQPIDTGSGCLFFLIVSIVSSYLLF